MFTTLKKFISSISPKNRGIICIILSALSFSFMNLFIRLSGDLPVFEKAFFRNFIAFLIAFITLARTEEKFRIKTSGIKYLTLRSVFGTIGLLANFYAASHINIADSMMLNKLSPFFAVIASVFLLKEVANRHQWASIIVALAGAVFVVKPSFIFGTAASGDTLAATLGFIGGIGAGLAYACVRKLSYIGERSPVIVFFFSGFSTIVIIPFVIFDFVMPTPVQLVCLIMTGVAAAGGQFGITAAYKFCPAKEISVYDYSGILFSAILGFLFLEQYPDWLSIIGYVLIIGAGIYTFLYNNGKICKHKEVSI